MIWKTMMGCVCFAVGALAVGCAGPQIQPADQSVSVTVGSNTTLADAVTQAAAHRRWVPSRISDETIRCTIEQRGNRVVIDIKMSGGGYTVHSVSCNIPQRKYDQWVNNLIREIAKYASR